MADAVLIVGAGIAGIEAALDLANQGFRVYLVEKNPSIGGRMAQLDKTFPKLKCASSLMAPKMLDVGSHPNIRLYAYSDVTEIRLEARKFKAKIQSKPRFVDENRCTGCGICARFCPVETPNECDEGIGLRSAIYVPFPQALPLIYTIDKEHCLQCELCQNLCPMGAIDYAQKPTETDVEVGAIIVTTGFELFDAAKRSEYGFGRFDNVLSGLALERLLSVGGPTGGRVLRRSDGKIPKKMAFIQCVAPVDEESGDIYCSKVCCMYTTKQAVLVKEQIPDVDITIYYPGALAFDKSPEELYQRAKGEFRIRYVKGKVTEVEETSANNNLRVRVQNDDHGGFIEDEVDMVVLSTGLVPAATASFGKVLQLKVGKGDFFVAADRKTDSVSTNVEGVFIAGVAEGPKDISDSIVQAKEAASKASVLLKQIAEKGQFQVGTPT